MLRAARGGVRRESFANACGAVFGNPSSCKNTGIARPQISQLDQQAGWRCPMPPCQPLGTGEALNYFRCLLTSLVISNMLTVDLPPNTAFSAASALIMRLFFWSCSPFFLI